MTGTRAQGRTLAALASSVLTVAVLAACAGAPATEAPAGAGQVPATAGPTTTGAQEPITAPDALALGEELTAALASGDVLAWLDLTDLSERDEQQQRDWFSGVQAVPMDLREMHPTFLVKVDDGAGGALVRFAFRHQVSGVDQVPVLELYDLTLRWSPTGWRITAVAGADDERAAYPQLWDQGPIVVHEGAHSIVLAPAPGIDDAVVRELDAAVGAALREMPIDGAARLLVEASDPATMREQAGRAAAGTTTVGSLQYFPLSSPEIDRVGLLPDVEDGGTAAPRIARDAKQLSADTWLFAGVEGGLPGMRSNVITIAALHRHPGAPSLTWVDTGLSRWFSSAGDAAVWQSEQLEYSWQLGGGGVMEFPPAEYWEFFGDSAPTDFYTAQAGSIFRYVEQVHGREAVFPLAEDLLLVVPGSYGADAELDEAFERHLGLDAAEVEAEWAVWVAQEFGG